jgi:hypothetical protein
MSDGKGEVVFHQLDPFTLPRMARREEIRTFVDARFASNPISVHLHSIDGVEVTMALEQAERYVREFTDDPDSDEAATNPKYFILRGQPIKLSRRIVQNICFLLQMQQEVPEDRRFDFEKWVAIAKRMENAWVQIMAWSMTFAPQVENPLGNSQAGRMAGSSTSLPNGTNGIPSLSSAPTSSSVGSTSSFERSGLEEGGSVKEVAKGASPPKPQRALNQAWATLKDGDSPVEL